MGGWVGGWVGERLLEVSGDGEERGTWRIGAKALLFLVLPPAELAFVVSCFLWGERRRWWVGGLGGG